MAAGQVAASMGEERCGWGRPRSGATNGPGEALISALAAEELSCDANVQHILMSPAGKPLDIGRKTRVIPEQIRTALILRDGGCIYPNCDKPQPGPTPITSSIGRGGPTSLTNLALLCSLHHTKSTPTTYPSPSMPTAHPHPPRPPLPTTKLTPQDKTARIRKLMPREKTAHSPDPLRLGRWNRVELRAGWGRSGALGGSTGWRGMGGGRQPARWLVDRLISDAISAIRVDSAPQLANLTEWRQTRTRERVDCHYRVVIDRLLAHGVTDVVLAPGSRSNTTGAATGRG